MTGIRQERFKFSHIIIPTGRVGAWGGVNLFRVKSFSLKNIFLGAILVKATLDSVGSNSSKSYFFRRRVEPQGGGRF